jgi:hypothetical protein
MEVSGQQRAPTAYRPRQKLMVFTVQGDRVDLMVLFTVQGDRVDLMVLFTVQGDRVDLRADLDVLQREKSLAPGGNSSRRLNTNLASDFLHISYGSYVKGLH